MLTDPYLLRPLSAPPPVCRMPPADATSLHRPLSPHPGVECREHVQPKFAVLAFANGLIFRHVVYHAKFNLHKKLDAVVITSHDVDLPPKVAKELELLWQTMLPGVTNAYMPSS